MIQIKDVININLNQFISKNPFSFNLKFYYKKILKEIFKTNKNIDKSSYKVCLSGDCEVWVTLEITKMLLKDDFRVVYYARYKLADF